MTVRTSSAWLARTVESFIHSLFSTEVSALDLVGRVVSRGSIASDVGDGWAVAVVMVMRWFLPVE